MRDFGNGIGANRGTRFHFRPSVPPAGENGGHMRADCGGHVVMMVACHDRAARVTPGQCNGVQQVARIRLAGVEAVPATHGHKPFFQIKNAQDVARGGNGFVGAYGHAPSIRPQARQHGFRTGKGAGQVGGMGRIVGHVAGRGFGRVNRRGSGAGMGKQAPDQHRHTIANHGAH